MFVAALPSYLFAPHSVLCLTIGSVFTAAAMPDMLG
jgi:hypothetical protein